MSQFPDLDVLKDIPGYQAILKAVLKSQIQVLVEQLSEQTGEESVLLTASVTDGTLCHLGSPSGKIFLDDHDDFKSQFLGFCLKRHHKRKTNEITERPQELSSNSAKRQKVLDIPMAVNSPSIHPSSLQHVHPGRNVAGRRRPASHSEVYPVSLSESMSLIMHPQIPAADSRNQTVSHVAEQGPAGKMDIKQEQSVADNDNAASRLDTDQGPSGSDSRSIEKSNITVKQEVEEDDLEITGVELSNIPHGSENSQPGFDSGQWLHTAATSTAAYDTPSTAADQMSNGSDNGSDYSNKSWMDDETVQTVDCRLADDWVVMEADGGLIINGHGLPIIEGQHDKQQLIENAYTGNEHLHEKGLSKQLYENKYTGREPLHEIRHTNQQPLNESKHTIQKTAKDVQLVKTFLQSKGETRELEDIEPDALDPLIAEFLLKVKKQNGDDYNPKSIPQIINSVDRYMRHKGYGHRIMHGCEIFQMTKKALKDRQDTLMMQGKCMATRTVESLTVQEIDILFAKGLLGTSSSSTVINTLWLYNTKYFGLKKRHEHYKLTWGDLELKQLPDGSEYLEYKGASSRARFQVLGILSKGPLRVLANKLQPDRCPVAMYKFYASKRPKACLKKEDPFYLGTCKPTSDLWFSQKLMGLNRHLTMFKTMLEKAGLDYKYVL